MTVKWSPIFNLPMNQIVISFSKPPSRWQLVKQSWWHSVSVKLEVISAFISLKQFLLWIKFCCFSKGDYLYHWMPFNLKSQHYQWKMKWILLSHWYLKNNPTHLAFFKSRAYTSKVKKLTNDGIRWHWMPLYQHPQHYLSCKNEVNPDPLMSKVESYPSRWR